MRGRSAAAHHATAKIAYAPIARVATRRASGRFHATYAPESSAPLTVGTTSEVAAVATAADTTRSAHRVARSGCSITATAKKRINVERSASRVYCLTRVE